MESLHEQLNAGFSKVTKSTCQKIIAEVWKREEAQKTREEEGLCTGENCINAEDDFS